jgi:secreted trypsin-like serine protease
MSGRGRKLIAALLACAAVAVPVGSTAGAAPPQEPNFRVLGGGPADFAQWPFAAAILRKGRFHCSGSVLNATHVLTAGHCAIGFKTGTLSVVTGRPDLRDTSVGQVHAVSAKFVSTPFKRHDLSVLRLATPTSSPGVTLASPEEDFTATAPGLSLRVAGWGATTIFHRRLPGFLKATVVNVKPKRKCFRAYRKGFKSVSMICAQGAPIKKGRLAPRTSPCGGDSGGPLIADTPNGPRLVGAVSFGPSLCGLPFAPVVFARVADDLDFLVAAVLQP